MTGLRMAALLLLAATAVRAAEPYRAFTVPWEGDPARGTVSMRIAPDGDVYVARAGVVDRYAPGGRRVETIALARGGGHWSIADLAFDRAGALYALASRDRGGGSVLHVRPDGEVREVASLPPRDGRPRLFDRLEVDHLGRLLVHDAYDDALVRVDAGGAVTELGPVDGFPDLVLDRAGALATARLAAPEAFTSIVVETRGPGAPRVVARLALAEPATELALLGCDDAGRYYVEVAHGPGEEPAARAVWVVGQGVTSIAVPMAPWEVAMARARAVLPSGGVLTARATDAGLVIEPHPLR